MRDRDRLIFGGSQTDSGQERWSRQSGSPVDSGSMLFQNIKVGAVEPGGGELVHPEVLPLGEEGRQCGSRKTSAILWV